ncbi:MAG: hypothetical protein WD738_23920 [Pirellulales bacterium]
MSHPYIYEGKQLLAALGIDPVYIIEPTDAFCQLSNVEHRYVWSGVGAECSIAFTSPVLDLLLSNCLRYEWQGRGCCIALCRSVLQMTASQTLGVLLHEAGHHVAAYDRPERDDDDKERALKTAWASMGKDGEAHNTQWLRATVNLWHRACKMGYEIPLDDVVTLEQYGFDRSHLLPLLDEAEQREGEPIETILGSSSTAPASTTSTAKRRRRQFPYVDIIGAEPVTLYADGSLETIPDIHGKRGKMKYQSVHDFLNARELAARQRVPLYL